MQIYFRPKCNATSYLFIFFSSFWLFIIQRFNPHNYLLYNVTLSQQFHSPDDTCVIFFPVLFVEFMWYIVESKIEWFEKSRWLGLCVYPFHFGRNDL